MPRLRLWSYFSGFILLLVTISVVAQSACPVLVEQAFDAVEEYCLDGSRNSICYGANQVNATFYEAVPEDYFIEPGDFTGLSEVEVLQTVSLNIEEELWGVAVIQAQLNLPDTLPGQNAVMILLGDATLTDDVDPNIERPEFEPIPVQTIRDANIRSGPGLRSNVIDTLQAGEAFVADGIDETGQWVRIIQDNRPAWIFADLLAGNIETLSLVDNAFTASMQAYHLSTGIGPSRCSEAPDTVLVQGQEEFEIDFTVNDSRIRIGSTVLLDFVDERVMQMIVIDGRAWVDNLVVPAGWKAFIDIDPDDGMSAASGRDELPTAISDWYGCEPINDADREKIRVFFDIPQEAFNYPLEMPPQDIGYCGAPSTGTVSTGGSTATETASALCDFELIGPFSEITPRLHTFEWEASETANMYEVVFYNYSGEVAQTFFTTDTQITLNVGEIPTGSELQWEVRGYRDDTYLCVSQRTPQIFRLADPNPPPIVNASAAAGGGAVITFSAVAVCTGATSFDVIYTDAPAGNTSVDMLYTDVDNGPDGHFGGTATANTLSNLTPLGPSQMATNIRVVAQPSGLTVNAVPSSLTCP